MYDVIYSFLVLIEKMALFNKQLYGFIISLKEVVKPLKFLPVMPLFVRCKTNIYQNALIPIILYILTKSLIKSLFLTHISIASVSYFNTSQRKTCCPKKQSERS